MKSSQNEHFSIQIFVQLVVRQAMITATFEFSVSVLKVLLQGRNPPGANLHSETEAEMLADSVVLPVKSRSEAAIVNNVVVPSSMRSTSR